MNSSSVRGAFFAKYGWLILAGVILLLGTAVRAYDLTDPPLDFHPTRQLHSLIMARGMFDETAEGIPDWQRQRAVVQWKAEGLIEPPIMENLVAATYRAAGAEIPWAGRAYSILFWTLGGIGLYLLAREFFSAPGALVALALYEFLPFAIFASRSFQPDPLMTALLIFAWLGFARWLKTHTWGWALLAGALGAAVILVKGTAIFLVAGAWVGGVLAVIGLRRALRDPQVWALALLTVLPYLVYTVYGIQVSGQLQGEFSLRFFPQYWVDPAFYLRWYGQLTDAFSLPWLLLGLLGLIWLPGRVARGIVWGGWLGYLAMGFALSHHISTHSYYHLPLVPLVALGVAALAEVVFRNIPEPRRLFAVLAGIVLLAGMVLSAWNTRTELKKANYASEPAFWQDLAAQVGRDASVAGIFQDYGYRLEYYGWISPSNWLTAADFALRKSAGQNFDVKQLFKDMTAGKEFFIVTVPDELALQPELRDMLDQTYPVFKRGTGYVIYDLRSARPGN